MTSIIKIVKANRLKKPEYVEHLKDIAKSLNRIAEELAVMNERRNDEKEMEF